MSKTMTTHTPKLPEPTAIKSVNTYTASPVECCDRCGQGIKYVAIVTLKDGSFNRYGMDCINKILAGDTSLKGLFTKNAKLLAKYKRTLEILSMPIEDMAVDTRGYYDRGFYFIADDEGKSLHFDGRSFFHPTKVDAFAWENTAGKTMDMRGDFPGATAWEPYTPANWERRCLASITKAKPKLEADIARLSGFLARILAKGIVTTPKLKLID